MPVVILPNDRREAILGKDLYVAQKPGASSSASIRPTPNPAHFAVLSSGLKCEDETDLDSSSHPPPTGAALVARTRAGHVNMQPAPIVIGREVVFDEVPSTRRLRIHAVLD